MDYEFFLKMFFKTEWDIKFMYQVFPLKAELLKPQEEMERHIVNLVKQVLNIY